MWKEGRIENKTKGKKEEIEEVLEVKCGSSSYYRWGPVIRVSGAPKFYRKTVKVSGLRE